MINLFLLYDTINLTLLFQYRDQSWAWGSKPKDDLMGMLDKLANLGYRSTLRVNARLTTLRVEADKNSSVIVWWPTVLGTFIPTLIKWEKGAGCYVAYTAKFTRRGPQEMRSLPGVYRRELPDNWITQYVEDYHRVDIEQGIDPPEVTTVTYLLIKSYINE